MPTPTLSANWSIRQNATKVGGSARVSRCPFPFLRQPLNFNDMIIQVVIPKWQSEYIVAMSNSALECGAGLSVDGIMYMFHVVDLPHWLHVYFHAMVMMSKTLTLSEVSVRRRFRVVDWNVRCWVQVEGAQSLRYGLED